MKTTANSQSVSFQIVLLAVLISVWNFSSCLLGQSTNTVSNEELPALIDTAMSNWFEALEFKGKLRLNIEYCAGQGAKPDFATMSGYVQKTPRWAFVRLGSDKENGSLFKIGAPSIVPLDYFVSEKFRLSFVDRFQRNDIGDLRQAVIEAVSSNRLFSKNETFIRNLPIPIFFAAGMSQGIFGIGNRFSESTYLKFQACESDNDFVCTSKWARVEDGINFERKLVSKHDESFSLEQQFSFKAVEGMGPLLYRMRFQQRGLETSLWEITEFRKHNNFIIPLKLVANSINVKTESTWQVEAETSIGDEEINPDQEIVLSETCFADNWLQNIIGTHKGHLAISDPLVQKEIVDSIPDDEK